MNILHASVSAESTFKTWIKIYKNAEYLDIRHLRGSEVYATNDWCTFWDMKEIFTGVAWRWLLPRNS